MHLVRQIRAVVSDAGIQGLDITLDSLDVCLDSLDIRFHSLDTVTIHHTVTHTTNSQVVLQRNLLHIVAQQRVNLVSCGIGRKRFVQVCVRDVVASIREFRHGGRDRDVYRVGRRLI